LPVRLRPLAALQPPDTLETWTRSPTKSEVDPVVGSWHLTTGEGESIPENISSSKDLIKLLPMPETFDVDRGLLLAVQAIQVGFYNSIDMFHKQQFLDCPNLGKYSLWGFICRGTWEEFLLVPVHADSS
jgi:hypothetical protein